MVLFVKRIFAIKVSGPAEQTRAVKEEGEHGRGVALVKCQGSTGETPLGDQSSRL